jgi:flagellar biosynthetic protein FliP
MVRHAFGMPETPPNPVLISLALFLTAFTMSPTLTALNTNAVQPLLANRIGVEEAMKRGTAPLRDFMLAQTRDADIEAIYSIANATPPDRPEQVDILKLAPAFMLNELRVSFTIGFVILLPFLLIDLVVSAILLSLGMMMVPPATISLPIKLLMFVLIDGWSLILQGVLGSFR